MSIYVLLEYVTKCRKESIKPTIEGLYEYSWTWVEVI